MKVVSHIPIVQQNVQYLIIPHICSILVQFFSTQKRVNRDNKVRHSIKSGERYFTNFQNVDTLMCVDCDDNGTEEGAANTSLPIQHMKIHSEKGQTNAANVTL